MCDRNELEHKKIFDSKSLRGYSFDNYLSRKFQDEKELTLDKEEEREMQVEGK